MFALILITLLNTIVVVMFLVIISAQPSQPCLIRDCSLDNDNMPVCAGGGGARADGKQQETYANLCLFENDHCSNIMRRGTYFLY